MLDDCQDYHTYNFKSRHPKEDSGQKLILTNMEYK